MRKKNDSKEKPAKKREHKADEEAHEGAEDESLEEPKRKSAKSSKVAGFFNQFILVSQQLCTEKSLYRGLVELGDDDLPLFGMHC